MSIAFTKPSLVTSAGQTVALSQVVQVTASASNPAYLVLNGLDRNEYTASSSGTTGTFTGNGSSSGFNSIGGDARGAGIVFSYQTASGRYYNSTYGYLDQMTYTVSSSWGSVADLSLFGTSSAQLANSYASNATALAQRDAGGYLGTLTVATQHGWNGTVPSQATPQSIAAIANTFVGQAWNTNGCWVLASTISAEAGASLPVQSTANMAGAANGEWFVAYNGPAGSTGDWQSQVRVGDMVGFVTSSGSGHITTCVAGSGSTAMVVDNITYVNSSGAITNSANDGSANDIIISAAHSAAAEFSGVQASSVVIYRLDTPVITSVACSVTLSKSSSTSLSGLFSSADPAGKAITSYQIYNTNAADTATANGSTVNINTVGNAVTVSSLSQISYNANAVGSDTITVRAFNGSYWGDWSTISVTDTAGAVSASTATTTPTVTAAPGASTVATAQVTSDTVSVYRFFDKADGTHFFTASDSEKNTLLATRSDLQFEGTGLNGYSSATATSSTEGVFRFFDAKDGTHFYTASTSERDALINGQSDMKFEGVAFYADATQQAGDSAVYRFFDTTHGTHLYTQSAAESAQIMATRTDLVSEGIAFYAPS